MRIAQLTSLIFITLMLSVFFISQAVLAAPLLLKDNVPAWIHSKIYVSPTGNIYVIWPVAGGVNFARSIDGGATFDNRTILRGIGNKDEDKISLEMGVHQDGTIFIFCTLRKNKSSALNLFMATSSDEGETFQTRIILNEENDIIDKSHHYKSYLSTNDLKIIDDAIYFTIHWDESMVLARSLDGGINFEFFTVARNDENLRHSGISDHSIGVDSKGNVYVVYLLEYHLEGDDFPIFDLYFTRLKSDEDAFEPPMIIGGCHLSNDLQSIDIPRTIISSDDKLAIIWSETEIIPGDSYDLEIKPYYYRISDDGGESFTEPVKLNFGNDDDYMIGIAAEIDNDDVIHFIYRDEYNCISYARSADFFQSFSFTKQVISTDRAPQGIDFFPVSGSEIYLTWTEYYGSGNYKQDVFFSSLKGDFFDNNPADDQDDTDPTPSQGENGGGGGGGCFIDSIIE